MCREMLDVGCQMKQFTFVAIVGMDSLNGKLSTSQRARLVENHGTYFRQHIHVVGSLDKDSMARCSAYATEEGQWYADNQCTGA